MREIMTVMRSDFITAKPIAFGGVAIFSVFILIVALVFFPAAGCYLIFLALSLIVPLGSVEKKSNTGRLNGVLPVSRKNITRGRFCYLFTLMFTSELAAFLVVFISVRLKLYRLFPDRSTEFIQLAAQSFSQGELMGYFAAYAIFMIMSIIFGFIEMTGQIFGRDKEMKILLIVFGAILAVSFVLILLNDADILPVFEIPKLPDSTAGKTAMIISGNIVTLVMILLFGEITARTVSKREL